MAGRPRNLRRLVATSSESEDEDEWPREVFGGSHRSSGQAPPFPRFGPGRRNEFDLRRFPRNTEEDSSDDDYATPTDSPRGRGNRRPRRTIPESFHHRDRGRGRPTYRDNAPSQRPMHYQDYPERRNRQYDQEGSRQRSQQNHRERERSPDYTRPQRGRGRSTRYFMGGDGLQHQRSSHDDLYCRQNNRQDDFDEWEDHCDFRSLQHHREYRRRRSPPERHYHQAQRDFDSSKFASEDSDSEDSVGDRYKGRQGHGERRSDSPLSKDSLNEGITRESLIKTLLKKSDLKDTLLNLHEELNVMTSSIRSIASENANTFQTVDNTIELRLSVKVCSAHNGTKGCLDRLKCKNLHICSKYVDRKCSNQDCVMGHSWNTRHNTMILKGFKVQHFPPESLKKLLELSLSADTAKIDPHSVSICYKYNNSTCQRQSCHLLHLCDSTIKGHSKCPKENCNLNHDILSSDCCKILKAAGIDVNESPRDILVTLLEKNPSLKKNDTVGKKNPSTQSIDQGSSKEDEATKVSQKEGSTPDTSKIKKTKKKKPYTVWSHHARGDISIAEICYNSVEGVCPNEKAGCQRLHAMKHYHWQASDNGTNWLNLQTPQITTLEVSFCDVASDGVDLPRVDPTLQGSWNSLLGLLGRESWTSDFQTMTMSDSANTKSLQIRRLCSETITGKQIDPSTYEWYFLDKQQTWVKYGKVDSVGEVNLVSSLTSDDIEKHFQSDSSKPLDFKNSKFIYKLDFQAMEQTNQNTQVTREVRRRPMRHLVEEEQISKGERKLPLEWDAMKPHERMKRVPIPPSSEEYQKVIQILANQVSPNCVTNIERVQNKFHWIAFQNKIEEMSAIHGDMTKVNVRQLFHGTASDIIPKICSENFDPKLHGMSAGQAWGQGAYFARDANMSYGYCKADSAGFKYMFVAQVAVGSVTTGNSSMRRPPINGTTGMPFDSTVDSTSNPSIIVKYDKAEYYPQYILTMK